MRWVLPLTDQRQSRYNQDMRISLIAAVAENNVIGAGGKIPWHLPADFKHFKELTMGHPVIMGRKTFESIGKPLSGRTNIVLSSPDASFAPKGCRVASSLEEAFRLAENTDEAFVIGGGVVYAVALPLANRVYLTRVHAKVDGDTFFPKLPETEWRLVDSTFRTHDDTNAFDCTFETYERNPSQK